MYKLPLIFLFLGSVSFLNAQDVIKGVMLAHNNQTIPYVNIGVVNTPIGTVSACDGLCLEKWSTS